MTAYNQWANTQVWEKISSYAAGQEIWSLFSHIQVAEHIWLSRITKQESQFDTAFARLEKEETQKLMAENNVAWQKFISEPHDPDRLISYHNLQGQAFNTALSHILSHVFNHSTYHRAQIASQMRKENIVPVSTDFIGYARLHLGNTTD